MAKNCINPNCEKEIPGSALYCNFCGTQQVSDGELNEEEKLRKELRNAEDTNQLLKKALIEAQNKTDNNASVKEIQNLKNQLAGELTNQNNLQKQICAKNKEIKQLKNGAKRKKRNAGWIFFLVVANIALMIITICLYVEKESWKNKHYSEQKEVIVNNDDTDTYSNKSDDDIKVLTELTKNWNNAHNTKDLDALKNLYSDNVIFYQTQLSNNACILKKESFFKKHPDFRQKISGEIKVEETDNDTYKCSFHKVVYIGNDETEYPSYLIFKKNSKFSIVAESDLITDRNLGKLQ